MSETTVYAFSLWIFAGDAASALSGSRLGGRFRGGSREFEIEVQGLSSVSAVAASDQNYLVIKSDGTVWA